MKAFTCTLALWALLVGPAAVAQNLQTAPAQSSTAPARQELRAYVQQNVLPVVRQQRQKLEALLTTSDKVQLAIYRTQLRETRQKSQALRRSFRSPASGETTSTLTETQKQQTEQLRAETKAILQNVEQLGLKYQTEIAKLAQEVQPQKEKWAADTKTILARTLTPEQSEALGRRKDRKLHRAGTMVRYFRPGAFLLLDPNKPAPAARSTSTTSVYPNPTTAVSQIEYDLKKDGSVTVELLDSRGNTLRTVAQQTEQEKGPHTLAINVADLPNGTYYFKITTKDGAETRRFVKE
ncbi:T9SS type A sorting domain-containing protein [Hymenobacter sp. AT01-02]|uniref:T9SS type A sorting domain-containing protein n=1 Tax=Hymenobacter sp. AT01-02 TaxID=1571877 RepID=UPI0005F0F760|nr:T9SS type A sorting domain-containing protein [Hymenobacter sp. AT01-02]